MAVKPLVEREIDDGSAADRVPGAELDRIRISGSDQEAGKI